MAPSDVESFTNWQYQPETDSFLIPGGSPETRSNLFELSGGTLRVVGGRVLDIETGRIRTTLSATRTTTLSIGNRGTIFVNRSASTRELVDAMGSERLPRVIIQGDLTNFGETVDAPINRMITLAPRGSLIYVNDAIPSGKARYTRIDAGVFGDAPPPKANEFGRLATAEDLVRRGIAGWLARNAASAVERLKIDGYVLPDGTTTISGSEIVAAIAATLTVTPIITYILQESVSA